jgi:predicted nucleic acid-binding protein
MNGNRYLLDTNAVLYILAGDKTLADFLFEEDLYLSVISEMELLSYKEITDIEKRSIKKFLSELTITGIDDKIKETTITVKQSSNLKLPDSIIAATSISLKLPLVTSDKQFKSLKDLDLVYYEKQF